MRSIILATLVLFLAQTPAYAGNGEVIGTLSGGALGGYIGNQFGRGGGNMAATIGGVIVGGYVGNRVGSAFDRENRSYATGGSYGASMFSDDPPGTAPYTPNYVAPPAPTPESFGYYNPATDGYCRQYVQPVMVGPRVEQYIGLACRQPDGSWQIVQ